MRPSERKQPGRGVEALERRVLMNGQVTVTFRSGDLTLSGDSRDNAVRVDRRSSTLTRVTGLEGTRVNGRSFIDFSDALDDVRLSLRQGGTDQVQIQGPLKIGGDLSGQIGEGEFIVEGSAGRVEIAGDMNVAAFNEGDVTIRNDVLVRGDADIRAGGSATAAANLGIVPDFGAARFSHPLDIDNPYFPLVPGTKYTYEERSVDDETGEEVVETIVVEVTHQTRTILGVRNRVLRDRVFVDGLLVEDTFDWHSQDDNGNVWYFGERSTDFEYDDEGNLIGTSTATSWQAGVDGAKPGIIMMARPTAGDAYYQEFERAVALDQGKVLATNDRVTVPAGSFGRVVRTKDTTVLSPGALEHKFYAPGVGLVQENGIDLTTGEIDGVLKLISVTRNGRPVTTVVPASGFTGVNATGRGTGPVQFRGESVFRSTGPLVLRETRFADEVEIFGGDDVTVVDTNLEDLTVQARGSVGLTNVRATEEMLLRADGDAYLFDSRFSDDVDIVLGPADNDLVIGRSRFPISTPTAAAGRTRSTIGGGIRLQSWS